MDFDNTLSRTTFNPKTGKYDMGEAIANVAQFVTDEYFNGAEIIIFSARPKREHPQMEEWLDREGIPFNKIKKKPQAKLYIDDMAKRPEEI